MYQASQEVIDGLATLRGAIPTGFTRRDFLGASMLGAAGAAVALSGAKVALADEAEETSSDAIYVPGTYTGTGTGISSTVTVTITVDETSITAVEVDASGETATIGAAAADTLAEQVLAAQSADIDGVSGATVTSNAVRTGAAAALAAAAVASDDAEAEEEAEEEEEETTATGMTFEGNEGKTMGEVLGAGWLGDEPEISDDEIVATYDTYILVCGAGHAGTACARKAAELGAQVTVIEKQAESSWSALGNDIGHLNSSWQMDINGVPEYDEVTFMNEYQIYCAGRAQPQLVHDFAYRSGEAFDWFIDNFTDDEKADITCLNWPVTDGYNYNKGIFMSYVGTPNFGGSVSLTEAVQRSQEIAKENGAEFVYETTAVKLVHNDDGTEVYGVIATNADGEYVQYNADAVVLACGDIGSNSQMWNAICAENYAIGEYKDCSSMMSGRDGSGIAMAMRIGAKVEIGTGGDMGSHAAYPLGPMEGAETLWLNKYGKRFCNEAYGGPLLSGCAVARQPGTIIYSVWDSDWKTVLLNQIAGHLALKYWDDENVATIESYMEAAIGSGEDGDDTSGKYLYCADTLEELFSYMGMEEGVIENAVAAVETWNAAYEAGRDDEFGRDPEMMWPIVEPPFYGYASGKSAGGGSLVSTSGLLVTGDQQVQGQGFEPIKGLYATGNTSGGRFPMGYNGIMNGVSIGMCLTLGMVLGEFLATADLDEATTLGLNNGEVKSSSSGGGGPQMGASTEESSDESAEGEAAEGEEAAEAEATEEAAEEAAE